MKKVIWMLAVALIAMPVFAQEMPVGKLDGKAVMDQRHEVFQKAHKAQMEKMKATKEKAEKLVKEYNGLKDGKKKDAKRAEIEKLVSSVREEQLDFNEKQLNQFEERLGNMKEALNKEKTAESKKAWVAEKSDKLIAENGDIKVLFDRMGQGQRMDRPEGRPFMKDGNGPKHFGKDGKCPFAKDGKKCEKGKDCKCGKHDGKFHKGPRVGINPPPPPAKEVK